ncbi:hypothetical protein [Halorubellus salinus]|uniref:hypothetical protein n=1 Tax=Halorubellus salinus TaxID=755309 RepID=UPI001D07F8BF|nr:hypothetical protein [Halorubellus salinus]
MEIAFRPTADPPGVEIIDPVEQRHLRLQTSTDVTPTAVSTDAFRFPVDAAVEIETSVLRFEQREDVHVHDANGEVVANLQEQSHVTIDGDTAPYELGIHSSIQLYCRVDGPFTIDQGFDNFEITFPCESRVVIAARTLHERPAGTIVTTPDERGLADAISLFSSALKTTSPERSFPTLRGHPPLVELGDESSVPEGIEPTESDVTIEVPESYRHLLTVAPLSYYLAADIEFADAARLVTEDGFALDLGTGQAFEDTVARTLKQQFLLDCVVRTEGLLPADLHERKQLEAELPFDLAATYECSVGERLRRYAQVPFDVVEPELPRWPLTAHVPADPDAITFLPFVVSDMGVVRKATGTVSTHTTTTTDNSTAVLGDSIPDTTPTGSDDTTANAVADEADEEPMTLQFVEPDHTGESLEHAWFGDHIPQGASMPTMAAFENQLDRGDRGDSIEIVVVCNDPHMIDEQTSLESAYGDRDELPYDVTTKFGLSTDALADFLTGDTTDFLHYIGHAERDGLRCIDGKLDVRELDHVNVQTFLLNACQSQAQAMALVERGAFGGVGTLGDVVNDYAIEIGKMFAHLLNLGFPLRSAIDIVSNTSTIGAQYLVVGDGSVDMVQSTGGNPLVCEVAGEGRFERDVQLEIYPTRYYGLGSQTSPTLDHIEDAYIVPAHTASYTVPYDELREYVAWMTYPLNVNGEWRWNGDFGEANLD